jgi:TIR domain
VESIPVGRNRHYGPPSAHREAAPSAAAREDLDEGPIAVGRSAPVASAHPRRPRSLRRSSAREPDEVHLGTSAPATVAAGEAFVARFAAYTKACRNEVHRVLDQEAPSAQPRLDLERCRWHPGTKVTVRLAADRVEVANPVQSFAWNGAWQILRFDATVRATAVGRVIVLRFDIAVEGLPLLALRPELTLLDDPLGEKAKTVSFVEARAPRSAFASYARGDRREVLGRVRSLQIFTGIDVFLDCLSIRPGEQWKPKLNSEISARDVFWLFWSRTARASEWVDWEWRTALQVKSLGGIQPHPLEPIELAPPPEELSALEFGSMYEWYLVTLRQSWFSRRLRRLWHIWLSLWGTLGRMAQRRVGAPDR